MKYTVLGVSAGNGVMLHPFKDNLIGNIEIRSEYKVAKRPIQFHLNFPNIPFWDTPDGTPIIYPDVIIGHPKCGNSSMFALSRGKSFTTSIDEPSLQLFFEAVNKYKPTIFAFENLPKMLETVSIEFLEKAFPDYLIKFRSNTVAIYGNSQITRNRLLVVGFNKNRLTHQKINRFEFPTEITKPKTTYELLKDLPENGHFTEPINEVITMYSGYKIKLSEAKRFWELNPEMRHWPTKDSIMNTAPGVYINREGDYPLTVRKTNRQFNPEGIQMSPRELARIQGIPDNFKILSEDFPIKTLINKGRFTVANTPPYEIGAFLKTQIDKILL